MIRKKRAASLLLLFTLCVFMEYNCIDKIFSSQAIETGNAAETPTLSVNCIQDLKSLNCSIGNIIQINGYYTAFDGVNSTYQITGSRKSDNGGTVIQLKNGLTAEMVVQNNTVTVQQFGAKGDGKTDDTNAIRNALNSGAAKVVFNNGQFKITDVIMMKTNDVAVQANNSVIFTDNNYRNKNNFYEWAFVVSANNISIQNLNIEARETIKVGYKTQFGVRYASNITLDNCKFNIPSSVLTNEPDRNVEYTNIDLYSDWHNVTIKNCTLEDFANSRAGSCLMARDLLQKKCNTLIFDNNTCQKVSHDEMIFVTGEGGTVTDVTITNNRFTVDENMACPSDVNFSLGTDDAKKTDNIKFENNILNCKSAYTLMTFGNSTNVSVKCNTINYSKVGSKGGCVVFSQGDTAKKIIINNNQITLDSADSAGISVFNNAKATVNYNNIICQCNVAESLFSGRTVTASHNNISVKKSLGMIGNNLSDFQYNTVKLSAYTGKFFQYYNNTLIKNANIVGNKIEYNNPDATKPTTALMIINSSLNNKTITLKGNKVSLKNKISNNWLYYVDCTDKTSQKIVFKSNRFENFKKRNMASKVKHNIIIQ